ncbi:MAG: excinuclease ABC subunit UvrA [Bacteroidetes bacterium]|nr:excinuclease ABC subunit UvrA [Bacteroidota bacterium]
MPPDTDLYIEVIGAREHNLKNIDLKFPRNKLIVFTGLSGSGKSSLAFDTIYAEGQRRYMESFSAYARHFIGEMKRPEVDKIEGLSPVISIEQKSVNKNPRSTVGTITEINDFLRLLYARVGEAYSFLSGEKMVKYTEEQIIETIIQKFEKKKIVILAPVIKARKGHYRELFQHVVKTGFTKVRIDGEITEIKSGMQLDRYKIHDIEVVIDRIEPEMGNKHRIAESVKTALKTGKGNMMLLANENNEIFHFSKFMMDPVSGLSYDEPQPNTFSFNSPYGACQRCDGLGFISDIDIDTIIPDKTKSIISGAILPLGEMRDNWTFSQLKALAKKYKFSLSEPISLLSEKVIDIILNGSDEKFDVEYIFSSGQKQIFQTTFKGITNMLMNAFGEKGNENMTEWAEEYMTIKVCPDCNGNRLKPESLHYKIYDKNISQLSRMNIEELYKWITKLEKNLSERQNLIAAEIIKEISVRLNFLLSVGLGYLNLDNPARTLSGGEAQRIRLATQIGSKLEEVLYILDEPSIGLHPRDNEKLIDSLKSLRDIGNTVIVVEHDKDMMKQSDFVVDIGPYAGKSGGKIIFAGNTSEFIKTDTLTSGYINGHLRIEIPEKRRKGNGKFLEINGCTGNNLKNVDLKLPLGMFVCVTGVSGSGKSTLINETLHPVLSQYLYKSHKKPLKYKKISGVENIDKVIKIDQSPIGRTPRSNPSTYVGFFTEIRNLFAQLPEAKIRGYKAGRFSFNVKGGRCEVCQGGGMRVIEMNFLPDVEIPCENCMGKRYNRETLEVRYKGKSISDVLDMTVDEAVDFFENIPAVNRKIIALSEAGLGYITLGQSSTTISGGEAQRVKIATELAKVGTGNTLYILDEPTTGLHFEDIKKLLKLLHRFVDNGNTVLVIEHNLDVVKVADYIFDLGPEGGKAGGNIIAQGTPEQIINNSLSLTGKFLMHEFK